MKKVLAFLALLVTPFLGAYSQSFYDMNTINTIEVTFEESNWDYLLDQLVNEGEEGRLLGSVAINGEVYDSVGVRYKGNSTYSANQVKNPFNIKLDYTIDDQEIEGYGTLKLANVSKDPSFLREVLSYEIARNYFPTGGSNFANVYVNGTHLGLYTSDQSVDKYFAQTNFGSKDNTFVKGELTSSGGAPPSGGVWEYFGQDSSSYYNYYDMKSDIGWDELIDFCDTLENHNDAIENVLNVDRHLWFLAFSNLFVNLDGPINNPQNYYLYKDNTGRFNPVLWDLNESFGGYANHQTLGQLGTTQMQHFTPFANLNANDFPIISKILTIDKYRKIYVAHMKTMIEEQLLEGQYEARGLEIQDIISDDVQADSHKFYSYNEFISNLYNSVGNGPQSIVGLVQLMDERADYIMGLTDFEYTAPEITDVSSAPEAASANSEVWFTAEVSDVDEVRLAYRSFTYSAFESVLMYDDGMHEDGAAGDGVYGINLTVGSSDLQYYIYAENSDAVALSPVRAEYEFYTVSVTLTTNDLVINELMADNESTEMDPAGEYDDWIELYNNGTESIDLEGYYLSDDTEDPTQWAFPAVTIPSGEYLIVWADKDEEQEGLHADFKLSASGETLILSSPSEDLLDMVEFGEQKADTTWGRYLNGVGDFIEMLPTFEAENTNELVGVNDLTTDLTGFVLFQNAPNPFSSYTAIKFSLDEGADIELVVVDSFGKTIDRLATGSLSSGTYSYTWQPQGSAPGLYFCVLIVDGASQVKKMILQ